MFEYGQIIEYVDATYDENFNDAYNWCKENNATFDELIDKRKKVEVEKTRTVIVIEQQEQVIPSEYDDDGNLVKKETTKLVEVPIEKEETYTEKELHRFFQINEIIEHEVIQEPEPTLEELKLAKREEINRYRNATEQGGFEYMGKVFDSDQISCQRISTAAQALQFMDLNKSGSIPVITWTCADNSKIDLTASDLAGLVIALMEHSNSCHQKATELKEQIEKAETKEELDNIRW